MIISMFEVKVLIYVKWVLVYLKWKYIHGHTLAVNSLYILINYYM